MIELLVLIPADDNAIVRLDDQMGTLGTFFVFVIGDMGEVSQDTLKV